MKKFTYIAAASAAFFAVTSAIALPQVSSTTTAPAPTQPSEVLPGLEGAGGAAVVPAAAMALTHKVYVSPMGGLYYDPQVVMAGIGDSIVFEFRSGNHTLTESTFASPCKKVDGGVDTDFTVENMAKADPGPRYTYTVKDTKPKWFHCKRPTACGRGMVFAINPTMGESFPEYRLRAMEQGSVPMGGPVPMAATPVTGASTTTRASTTTGASTATGASTTTGVSTTSTAVTGVDSTTSTTTSSSSTTSTTATDTASTTSTSTSSSGTSEATTTTAPNLGLYADDGATTPTTLTTSTIKPDALEVETPEPQPLALESVNPQPTPPGYLDVEY